MDEEGSLVARFTDAATMSKSGLTVFAASE
jgi:hypothetical protein